MACLRWNPVTATNASRMRPFSACLPLLYRSMTAATSSCRVAMLTRLIAISPTPSRPGAFQMRQRDQHSGTFLARQCDHRLATIPIAAVARLLAGEMMIHLGIQGSLGERLFQAVKKAVRIKGRLGIGPSQK